jgi:phage shock protein A
MAGYISYLNREHDARQFAIPTIKTLTVPLSAKSGPTLEEVTKELDAQKENVDALKEDIKQVKQKHKTIVSSRVENECGTVPAKQRKPCKTDVATQQGNELRRVLHPLEAELEVTQTRIGELKKQKKEATTSKKNDLSQESVLKSRCKFV